MSSFTERSSDVLHIIGAWATLAKAGDPSASRDHSAFTAHFTERGYTWATIERAWLEYTALRIRLRIRPQ